MNHFASIGSKCWATRSRTLCFVLLVGWMASSNQRVVAADASQYQQLLDHADYQTLISQVNAEISKKATADADRYKLLMLKGEALLHMKASDAAEDTFNAAAKIGPDATSTAIAKATVHLIKNSSEGKYQPKAKAAGTNARPAAIDIADPVIRKVAFSAFLTDLLAKLTPQVEQADHIDSLSPIIALAQQVSDARDVEMAATGADSQSKGMLEKLSTRAAALLSDTLKPLDEQISAVTSDAQKRQRMISRRATKAQAASLSPEDVGKLGGIASTAREVMSAVTQLQPIFGDHGDLKTVQTQAEKVIADVNKLLKQYHHSTD